MKRIKPFINTVYLTEYKDKKRFEKKNGLIYNTDVMNNATEVCVHEATVYAVPEVVGSDYELEIKEGDRVLCHHFLTDESTQKNVDGVKISELQYVHIYATYNDEKLVPIQDYVFVEPYEDNESGFVNGVYQKKKGKKERLGRLAYVGIHSEISPDDVGSFVIFERNREYEMEIGGKVYYRMRDFEIQGIVKNPKDVEVL